VKGVRCGLICFINGHADVFSLFSCDSRPGQQMSVSSCYLIVWGQVLPDPSFIAVCLCLGRCTGLGWHEQEVGGVRLLKKSLDFLVLADVLHCDSDCALDI